jgi:hypothetical protein
MSAFVRWLRFYVALAWLGAATVIVGVIAGAWWLVRHFAR